jgi:hypothetical protein
MTQEDWDVLEQEIVTTFTPGTPISETDLLAGRAGNVRQLQLAALDPGRHALVFGERGVGKSSLASTFHKPLNTATRKVLAVRIDCDVQDTFDSMWRKVFRRIKHVDSNGAESWADESHPGQLGVDDVVTELGSFPAEYCPIIVLDEFDRLRDDNCKALASDVVKSMSDYGSNCTLVFVGVAKSVAELIANHQSITRALIQVPIDRLKKAELRDIVTVRLRRLGMTIDEEALWRITFLSAGFPFYTHALGRQAAMRAVAAKKRHIGDAHVFDGMRDCMLDSDGSIKTSYVKATEKLYRKPNIFAEVLAACALAEPDALGKFSAAAVEAPLAEIMGREVQVSSFGSQLKELSKPERGALIERSGDRGSYKFNFTEPLMQPYVLMQSISQGIITQGSLSTLMAKAQMNLSLTTAP